MSADSAIPVWRLIPQDDFLRLALTVPTAPDTDNSPATPTIANNQITESLDHYLQKMAGRWETITQVHLAADYQLLDTRQLQAIADSLRQQGLTLSWVETTRRQTAVAAASAGYSVDQTPTESSLVETTPPLPPPRALIVRQMLRSGAEIRHNGDVVIIGDVNPGSSIVATGDILIWGCLRGTAHAGAEGNQEAVIMILRPGASQVRIANLVARVNDNRAEHQTPEIAYITSEGIRLTPVRQFSKQSLAGERGA